MITLLLIIFILIATYILIHNLRVNYLSGFISYNIGITIGLIPLLLFFIIYLFNQTQINLFMMANKSIGFILLIILFALLLLPQIIGDKLFEHEKNTKMSKWENWLTIQNNISLINKFFFYINGKKN
jgi:hypothetical protein